MIKNIIFDLGKVLIDYDFDIFFQKIGNKPNTRTLDEANKEILLFEAGKIDRYTFFEHLRSCLVLVYDMSIEQKYMILIFRLNNSKVCGAMCFGKFLK